MPAFAAPMFAALLAGHALLAGAAEPPAPVMETQMVDPWVPPSVRNKATAAEPSRTLTLREQVEKKLKDHFDAADVQRSGALTQEQARVAGLGYIANDFDRIDVRKTGTVRFDDVKAYLRGKGSALD